MSIVSRLWVGRSTVRFLARAVSFCLQTLSTWLWGPYSLLPSEYRAFFSQGYIGRNVKLTNHHRLLTRLGISGAEHLPLYAFMECVGTFTSYLSSMFVMITVNMTVWLNFVITSGFVLSTPSLYFDLLKECRSAFGFFGWRWLWIPCCGMWRHAFWCVDMNETCVPGLVSL